MAARPDVLDAMSAADQAVAAVVNQLKRLYGLTDEQLGEALEMDRRSFQQRRTGVSRFTVSEVAGLAAFFELEVAVFYAEPAVAVAAALERAPSEPASAYLTLR